MIDADKLIMDLDKEIQESISELIMCFNMGLYRSTYIMTFITIF